MLVDQPEIGRNLQDHPAVYLVYTHSQPVSLLTAGEPRYLKQFLEEGTGPLASNVLEAGGFARSGDGLAAPDIQFHAAPLMMVDGCLGTPTEHAISYGPCVLNPLSRGEVTLASGEPTAEPRIRHNCFSEPADMDVAVAGVRIGLEFAHQQALRPYTEAAYAVPESESDADPRA